MATADASSYPGQDHPDTPHLEHALPETAKVELTKPRMRHAATTHHPTGTGADYGGLTRRKPTGMGTVSSAQAGPARRQPAEVVLLPPAPPRRRAQLDPDRQVGRRVDPGRPGQSRRRPVPAHHRYARPCTPPSAARLYSARRRYPSSLRPRRSRTSCITGPAAMPVIDRLPVPVALRQIPPRAPSPGPEQDPPDHHAVVIPPVPLPRVRGHQRRQPRPLGITQVVPA
jgi:hypothetical protein